jgi:hypothetical protein
MVAECDARKNILAERVINFIGFKRVGLDHITFSEFATANTKTSAASDIKKSQNIPFRDELGLEDVSEPKVSLAMRQLRRNRTLPEDYTYAKMMERKTAAKKSRRPFSLTPNRKRRSHANSGKNQAPSVKT